MEWRFAFPKRFSFLQLHFSTTILVLNNITDYGSTYEFVRHVLMMDSTFPGNHVMWRAVNSPLVHTVFYIGIIAWESVTMLLC